MRYALAARLSDEDGLSRQFPQGGGCVVEREPVAEYGARVEATFGNGVQHLAQHRGDARPPGREADPVHVHAAERERGCRLKVDPDAVAVPPGTEPADRIRQAPGAPAGVDQDVEGIGAVQVIE